MLTSKSWPRILVEIPLGLRLNLPDNCVLALLSSLFPSKRAQQSSAGVSLTLLVATPLQLTDTASRSATTVQLAALLSGLSLVLQVCIATNHSLTTRELALSL